MRLLVLDDEGNECEIAGVDPTDDGLLGLPRNSYFFYPRADWIAAAIAKVGELRALEDKLREVCLHARLYSYEEYGEREIAVNLLFERLLNDFEQKCKLAEAGPEHITCSE